MEVADDIERVVVHAAEVAFALVIGMFASSHVHIEARDRVTVRCS